MAISLKRYDRQVGVSEKTGTQAISGGVANALIQDAGTQDQLISDAVGILGDAANTFFEHKAKGEVAKYEAYKEEWASQLELKKQEGLLNGGLKATELYDKVVLPEQRSFEKWVSDQEFSSLARKQIDIDVPNFSKKINAAERLGLIQYQIEENNFNLTNEIGTIQNKLWSLESQIYNVPEDQQDPNIVEQINNLKQRQNIVIEDLKRTTKAGVAEEALSKALYNKGLFIAEELESQYINGIISPIDYVNELTKAKSMLIAEGEGKSPKLLSQHQGKLLTIFDSSVNTAKRKVVKDRNDVIKRTSTLIERGQASTEALNILLEGQDEKVVGIINDAIRGRIQEQAVVAPEISDAWNVIKGFVDGEGIGWEEALIAARDVKSEASRELLIWMIADAAEEMADENPDGSYNTVMLGENNTISLNGTSARFVRTIAKFLKDFRSAGLDQESGYSEYKFFVDNIKAYRVWKSNPQGLSFDDWVNEQFEPEALAVITATARQYGYRDLVTDIESPLMEVQQNDELRLIDNLSKIDSNNLLSEEDQNEFEIDIIPLEEMELN
jgi:hypothetical protein